MIENTRKNRGGGVKLREARLEGGMEAEFAVQEQHREEM